MIDLDAVGVLVRRVCDEVHVPLFRQGVKGQQKSPGEWVSDVDRRAERLLTEGLADLTPDLPVVGEEAAFADPSLLLRLRAEQPVWLVDPLDGTSQFLAGSPDHAVMLALVHGAAVVAAVVHQPQHRRTYTAELGSGTWRDGRRLQTTPGAGTTAELRGGVLRRFLDEPARRAVDANRALFGDLTPATTCAGVEYPRIVEGGSDFLLFWRTLAWDHAPGALLLREAGGAAVRPDGSDYRPDDDRSGLLAAADPITAVRVLHGLGLMPH